MFSKKVHRSSRLSWVLVIIVIALFGLLIADSLVIQPIEAKGPPPKDTPTPTPTPAPTRSPCVNTGNIDQSVADCLAKMTLDEKVGQMTLVGRTWLEGGNEGDIANFFLGAVLSGGGSAPSSGNTPTDWADLYDNFQSIALSTPLQIPIMYGVDAVHGHNNVFGATIFPHNIGLGATRNPALIQEVGRITALEVVGTGIDWTFSPCLCVARDERWGRTYESFGEDPTVPGMMTSVINGYQGVGANLSHPETIAATAKHWVGDGGTTWGTGGSGYQIDQGDTQLTEQELRDIHIAPYIDAINNNVATIMISYSSWNGEKLHGHSYLINDVLKGELGFTGFVVSDWQGIDQLSGSSTFPDPYDVRTGINAGIDMIMVPDEYQTFINTLKNEINAGNIPMSRIDDAVSRILKVKFELGLFEQPFTDRTYTSLIGSAAHRDVARQAVRESLVLLKNDGILPLPKNPSKILVAGKNANNIGHQSGGWTITWQGSSGDITPGTTILEAIQNAVDPGTIVEFKQRPNGPLTGDFGIVVIGERPYAEGRGDDGDLALEIEDKNAVKNVCNAMPCVVILISGRPMIINDQLAKSNAFVAAWLPGTEGQGVADVIFGDFNFTGTLPMSWPNDISQVPINVGDVPYQPLFPFGFGLTYP